MKTILLAALALIVGLFLGSLPLRSELRQAKKDLNTAREEAAAASGGGGLSMAALGLGSLGVARQRRGADGAHAVPNFVVPDAGAAGTGDNGPTTGDGQDAGAEGRRRRGFSAEGMQAAKAAADLRAAQFRAAFFEEARLPPEKQALVEATIKTMNDELAQGADQMAEAMRARGQKIGPRDMADLGVKLLEVYRRGDDQLKGALDPATTAAKDKTNFDLMNQIDVGSFAKLAETMEMLGVSDATRRPR